MTSASRFIHYVLLIALMCGFAASQSATQSVFSQGEVRYGTYFNGRFSYAVAVPLSHLQPQGEASEGTQVFASPGGEELRVSGSAEALGGSLATAYAIVSQNAPGKEVTYNVVREDWFVVSGFEGEAVFYTRAMVHPESGAYLSFTLRYDRSLKPLFDPITEVVSRSFRALETDRQVEAD